MPRKYRFWTAGERRLVVEHYGPLSRAPWPTVRIARELGRTCADVREAARRWGRSWQECRPITPVQAAAARRLYNLGHSDPAIAIRLDISATAVRRWRLRNGLPTRYLEGARANSGAAAGKK
jgi:hypothetical protein